MYASTNFLTKKELRSAVQAGAPVTLYSPTLDVPATNGQELVQGPWPSRVTPVRSGGWKASVTLRDGHVVEVR